MTRKDLSQKVKSDNVEELFFFFLGLRKLKPRQAKSLPVVVDLMKLFLAASALLQDI